VIGISRRHRKTITIWLLIVKRRNAISNCGSAKVWRDFAQVFAQDHPATGLVRRRRSDRSTMATIRDRRSKLLHLL
jgi:hypothetical protein